MFFDDTNRLEKKLQLDPRFSEADKRAYGVTLYDDLLHEDNLIYDYSHNGIVPAENQPQLYEFGITALDEATGGFLSDDFVIIAAPTAGGKTELSRIISSHNAKRGNKVLTFSLESYNGEIAQRQLWGHIRKNLYTLDSKLAPRYLLRHWRAGKYNHDEFFQRAYDVARKVWHEENIDENSKILYRGTGGFTIEDFENILEGCKDEVKPSLIILDHLHFFDSMNNESENSKMRALCLKIRDLVLMYKIPVITFAHVRKGERGKRPLVSDYEEIHGSSDSYKVATMVITFAQSSERNTLTPYLSHTYFRIGKDRSSSGLWKYALGVNFDTRTGSYAKAYKIYDYKNYGFELEQIAGGTAPSWAKNFTNVRV